MRTFVLCRAREITVNISARRVKLLWMPNVAVFWLAVTASFLVDANGRLPGLNEGPSTCAAYVMFISGMALNVTSVVAIRDTAKRIAAVLMFALLVMLGPVPMLFL